MWPPWQAAVDAPNYVADPVCRATHFFFESRILTCLTYTSRRGSQHRGQTSEQEDTLTRVTHGSDRDLVPLATIYIRHSIPQNRRPLPSLPLYQRAQGPRAVWHGTGVAGVE